VRGLGIDSERSNAYQHILYHTAFMQSDDVKNDVVNENLNYIIIVQLNYHFLATSPLTCSQTAVPTASVVAFFVLTGSPLSSTLHAPVL